jgi:hypothetical protein
MMAYLVNATWGLLSPTKTLKFLSGSSAIQDARQIGAGNRIHVRLTTTPRLVAEINLGQLTSSRACSGAVRIAIKTITRKE